MCAIAHVVDEKRQSIEKLLFPRRDCISIPMLFYSHTDTHSNGIQSDKPLESKTQKKRKKISFVLFKFSLPFAYWFCFYRVHVSAHCAQLCTIVHALGDLLLNLI